MGDKYIALLLDNKGQKYIANFLKNSDYTIVEPDPMDPSQWSNVNIVIVDKKKADKYKNELLSLKYKFSFPLIISLKEAAKAEPWFKLGFDDVFKEPLSKEELNIRLRLWENLKNQHNNYPLDKTQIFQIMMDYSLVGSCLFNKSSFFYVSEALANLFGYTSSELLRMNFLDLVYPEDRERFKQAVFEPLGTRKQSSFSHIFRGISKQKQVIYCELVGKKIIYKNQPVIWAVLTDITKRKQAEEKLRLQERLSTVGQLAAGIAHDFNNILTGILGYAQLLLMRKDIPEDAKDFLGKIISQGDRAAALIRQILDFSRKSLSHQRAVNLGPFLKEITKMLKRLVPENIKISFNLLSNDCWVYADLTKIQQIITNLVLNAKDAIEGEGEISIELGEISFAPNQPKPFPQMSTNEWVVLKVSDTGKGIPPNVLSHIFEPFFTTKEVGKGSGLGLAQVYGIVKQHGGFIDVQTEPKKGTTFIIYFPKLRPNKRDTKGFRTESPTEGSGELILLVEDEPIVLEAISKMLEELGYKVIPAHTGQEALELYEKYKEDIQLLITDMVMPHMDGKKLIKNLREKGSKIKTIVMTGYPITREWEEFRFKHDFIIVPKPLRMDQLANLVKSLTSQG